MSGVETDNVDLAFLELGLELLSGELGETPLSGKGNLLSSGELHGGLPEGLHGAPYVGGLQSDGDEWLADLDPAHFAVGLAPSLSHTLLESIGTSAGKHLVDSDHMPRVDSDSEMVVVLTDSDHHMLVASNTGGLQSLGTDLLLLVGDQVHGEGEHLDAGLLVSGVVDPELGVGHTSVVPGLGVRLVLAISVAPGRSSSHL